MTRWLATLISLTLVGCKTPSKSPASPPSQAYVKTASEAKTAGLTSTELADLESFFDFVHSACRTGQYRIDPKFSREERAELQHCLSNSFAKSFDPSFMLLTNEQHLRLGLAYSPSSHRLHVMDPSKLPAYNEVSFDRIPTGYDLTYIDGCVHWPIKIVKNRGRPFIITVERPD